MFGVKLESVYIVTMSVDIASRIPGKPIKGENGKQIFEDYHTSRPSLLHRL